MNDERAAGETGSQRSGAEMPERALISPSDSMVRSIRALKSSPDLKGAARALFRLAAERPGEWITFAEGLKRSGVTVGQGQADIRAHWMGKDKPAGLSTPLETKTVAGGKKVYRLSPENARVWNSI
jgi:hypothetical protein